MDSYSVLFSKSIKQDIRGIEKAHLSSITGTIHAPADNPLRSGLKRSKGAKSTYRIRVGQYRVVYEVDAAAATINIYRIRHRKDVYR